MRSIYLFRHGQASFGEANYDALSERGHEQAQRLARRLLEEEIVLHRVLHGSLERQRDTALAYLRVARQGGQQPVQQQSEAFNEFQAEKVVRHHLPRLVQEKPELGELLREPEGFRTHFQRLFIAVIESWQADRFPHPRIETWPAFRERVRSGFEQLIHELDENQQAGIFTSGGVISVLLQPLMDEDDSLMPRLNQKIANASVTRLDLEADIARVSLFNDYAHLQAEQLVTFR